MTKDRNFTDRFTSFAVKIGQEIHLRSLRDAFALMMPLFILAGVGVLLNSVVFPFLFKGETLEKIQLWGFSINNATLNISGLLVCAMIGFCLAKNKEFENPILASLVSIASLIIMMPQTVDIIPKESQDAVITTGVLTFNNLGTTGMFAGIIMGLIGCELFIKFSKIKKLKINIGGNVPPAVNNSFNNMIPVIFCLSLLAFCSMLLNLFFGKDLINLISTLIQEPLRKINTSLIGTILIYSFGNLLFTFGIHQTVVNGSILEPLLLVNMNENINAFSQGKEIPYIINQTFVPTFGMIGGTGSTFCLLIAVFIFFRKNKQYNNLSKLAITPGLFNINEPVIFGFPIVFNIAMIIPFVLTPVIGIVIAYFATAIGFMNHVVVIVPWTTPPLLNAFLATRGDIRAVIVQIIIIVIGVYCIYHLLKLAKKLQLNKHKLINRREEA